MQNPSVARKAGIVGMAGAVLWIISIIVQSSVGLSGSESGSLWVVNELISLTAQIGMIIGFLGLIWGGAFGGRFGTIAVGAHVLGYTLIVLGGIAGLLLGDSESPLFLLYLIGAVLAGVAAVLMAVAVLTTARWAGWQRWIPLLYGIYYLLIVELPMMLGVTPDGPGISVLIGMGVSWFLVALAVYTAQGRAVVPQPSAIGQV
jgi:hypothetical protein